MALACAGVGVIGFDPSPTRQQKGQLSQVGLFLVDQRPAGVRCGAGNGNRKRRAEHGAQPWAGYHRLRL